MNPYGTPAPDKDFEKWSLVGQPERIDEGTDLGKKLKAALDGEAEPAEKAAADAARVEPVEPIYDRRGKAIGPLDRIRLDSERRTGVQTTIPRALMRLAGDVLFMGDTRKTEQNVALEDIAKGSWTKYAPMGSQAAPMGMPVQPPKRQKLTVSLDKAEDTDIDAQLSKAGLDPKAIRAAAKRQMEEYDAWGVKYDPRKVLANTARFEADQELTKRTKIKERAEYVLGANEKGFGYSFIGGGVQQLPYVAQYTLGALTGTGVAIPLLASYDRRYNENRETQYAIDPQTGERVVVRKGLSEEDAVRPSLIGAGAEVAVEKGGGELMRAGVGRLVSKLGLEKQLSKIPAVRRFVKAFGNVAKVTGQQEYPFEIAEEGVQEILDAGLAATPEYREGRLDERLKRAVGNFTETFPDLAVSMLLTQSAQAAYSAAKGETAYHAEKFAEKRAGDRLSALLTPEQLKTLEADGDLKAAYDYIAGLDPKAAQTALDAMSQRSRQIAEEVAKAGEWKAALGNAKAESRFVAPSPDMWDVGDDGAREYRDQATGIRVLADTDGSAAMWNPATGRSAEVSDGTPQENLAEILRLASASDIEAQGREKANAFKAKALEGVLRRAGTDGTYHILGGLNDVAAFLKGMKDRAAAQKVQAAVEEQLSLGNLPQGFQLVDADGSPVNEFVFILDNIRAPAGSKNAAGVMEALVTTALHETVHAGQRNLKGGDVFGKMYREATEAVRNDLARIGIERQLGKAAVESEMERIKGDDTARRRWFDEGVAYVSQAGTEQSEPGDRLRRKVKEMFGMQGVVRPSDVRVLTDRAMLASKGQVRVFVGPPADEGETSEPPTEPPPGTGAKAEGSETGENGHSGAPETSPLSPQGGETAEANAAQPGPESAPQEVAPPETPPPGPPPQETQAEPPPEPATPPSPKLGVKVEVPPEDAGDVTPEEAAAAEARIVEEETGPVPEEPSVEPPPEPRAESPVVPETEAAAAAEPAPQAPPVVIEPTATPAAEPRKTVIERLDAAVAKGGDLSAADVEKVGYDVPDTYAREGEVFRKSAKALEKPAKPKREAPPKKSRAQRAKEAAREAARPAAASSEAGSEPISPAPSAERGVSPSASTPSAPDAAGGRGIVSDAAETAPSAPPKKSRAQRAKEAAKAKEKAATEETPPASEAAKAKVEEEKTPDGDTVMSVPSKDRPGLPTKEQKKYLLAEIDKALENAPYEPQAAEPPKELLEAREELKKRQAELLRRRNTIHSAAAYQELSGTLSEVENELAVTERKIALASVKTVTFEVPGDGVFVVPDNRASLSGFKKMIEKAFPEGPLETSAVKEKRIPNPSKIGQVGKRERVTSLSDEVAKLLKPFVSTDERKKILQRPYWNPEAGEAVATDGIFMAVMIGEPDNSGSAKAEEWGAYERCIVGYRKGQLPAPPRYISLRVDSKPFARKLKQALSLYTAIKVEPKVWLYIDSDGVPGFKIEVPEVGGYDSLGGKPGYFVGCYDADKLLDSVLFLRKTGNNQIGIAFTDNRSPILLTGEAEYVIQMPAPDVKDTPDIDHFDAYPKWKRELSDQNGSIPPSGDKKKEAQPAPTPPQDRIAEESAAKPPLPSKTVRHSITRAMQAIEALRGPVDKKRFESAYQTLRAHAAKLGVETPRLGTYFHAAEYRQAADAVALAIRQKYGASTTSESPVAGNANGEGVRFKVERDAEETRRQFAQLRALVSEADPADFARPEAEIGKGPVERPVRVMNNETLRKVAEVFGVDEEIPTEIGVSRGALMQDVAASYTEEAALKTVMKWSGKDQALIPPRDMALIELYLAKKLDGLAAYEKDLDRALKNGDMSQVSHILHAREDDIKAIDAAVLTDIAGRSYTGYSLSMLNRAFDKNLNLVYRLAKIRKASGVEITPEQAAEQRRLIEEGRAELEKVRKEMQAKIDAADKATAAALEEAERKAKEAYARGAKNAQASFLGLIKLETAKRTARHDFSVAPTFGKDAIRLKSEDDPLSQYPEALRSVARRVYAETLANGDGYVTFAYSIFKEAEKAGIEPDVVDRYVDEVLTLAGIPVLETPLTVLKPKKRTKPGVDVSDVEDKAKGKKPKSDAARRKEAIVDAFRDAIDENPDAAVSDIAARAKELLQGTEWANVTVGDMRKIFAGVGEVEIGTREEVTARYHAVRDAMKAEDEAKAEEDRRVRNALRRLKIWENRVENARKGIFPEHHARLSAAEKSEKEREYERKANEAKAEYEALLKASPRHRMEDLRRKINRVDAEIAALDAKLVLPEAPDPRTQKKEPAPAPSGDSEEERRLAAMMKELQAKRAAAVMKRRELAAKWKEQNPDIVQREREARRLAFLQAKFANLERQLLSGEFAQPKKKPKVWNADIAIAQQRVRDVQQSIEDILRYEANKARGPVGYLINWYERGSAIYKYYMASWDMSNVGVQSSRLFAHSPIYGLKAIKEAGVNALFKDHYWAMRAQMYMNPLFKDAVAHGLAHSHSQDDYYGNGPAALFFENLETRLRSSKNPLARWIPGTIAAGVNASQRAFETYGDLMRMHVYASIVTDPAHLAKGGLTDEDKFAIANMVNIMGGVGNTKIYGRDLAGVLSKLMWSSRLFTAQLEIMTGGGGLLWNAGLGPEHQRKALGRKWYQTATPGAAKMYARVIAGNIGLCMLFEALGRLYGGRQPWEDEETLFWKAWNFLFGKRRMGNTIVDTSGGMTGMGMLARKLAGSSHVSASGRDVTDIGFHANLMTLGTFFRGRLQPHLSLALNLMLGEDLIGEPYGPFAKEGKKLEGVGNMFKSSAVPISPGDIYGSLEDLWNTHGAWGLVAGAMPLVTVNMLGFAKNVQPRDPMYEINRHKSHLGQYKRALKKAEETGDWRQADELFKRYSFDIMVEKNIAALTSAAEKARKAAEDPALPKAVRKMAEEDRLLYLRVAREALTLGD